MYEELAVRVEFFGDEIERLSTLHPVTGEVVTEDREIYLFPASHYVAGPERMERAIAGIEVELADRLAELEREHRLLEAQRLRMRTSYDIEMMRQIGTCSGIENYSRHIDGRPAGSPPNCLLDYFPSDFLLVIDESHITVPQIGGMYEGDMSRKRTLVEHGFRLPSAIWTTGRCASRSSWRGSARPSICLPHRATTSWPSREDSSNSSLDLLDWSILR
jgi:excinuclease ABC subunit B